MNFQYVEVLFVQSLTFLVPFNFDKYNSRYMEFTQVCSLFRQNRGLKCKNLLKIEILLDLSESYIIVKLIEPSFISNKFHFILVSRVQVMSSQSWGNLPALSLSGQDMGKLGRITGSNRINLILKFLCQCQLSNKIWGTLFEVVQGELCPAQPTLVKSRCRNLV